MAESFFPILGTSVPPLIGRQGAMQRLWNDLTKPSPSHLSIVGPRFAGKTVLMRGLAERMRQGSPIYKAVIEWDLGHQTPSNDEDFLGALRAQLVKGINLFNKDYSEHLRGAQENHYQAIREVLEAVADEGQRILMLCDGFDKPLGEGKLTRNLWDQLRDLASLASIRLVTASRRRLAELVRSEDSRTSDFWGIFDTNALRVECFDDTDVDAILGHLPELTFSVGAKTELSNWTGKYPPLILTLLNAVHASKQKGSVDDKEINHCANIVRDQAETYIKDLWRDCRSESRDLFQSIAAVREMPIAGVGKLALTDLTEKGFVKLSANKLGSGCRFLEKYVEDNTVEMSSLIRHFDSSDAFRSNIRTVMERRLCQLKGLDAHLYHYLERALEDIPEHPERCLSSVRGIIDYALDLVWEAEFGLDKKIPTDWLARWRQKEEKGIDKWNEQLPMSRGEQIRLLQLMTGTEKSVRVAKYTSKSTYVLANSAKGFGDYGQHMDRTPIDVGVAFSAICTCIELARNLLQELPKS